MIPDAAALFDETEGARDPFFGVMETGYDLPSPSSLMQVDHQRYISKNKIYTKILSITTVFSIDNINNVLEQQFIILE